MMQGKFRIVGEREKKKIKTAFKIIVFLSRVLRIPATMLIVLKEKTIDLIS